MDRCTDDLKKSQKKPIDEFGVKNINKFYVVNWGMVFCLLKRGAAKYAVEKHHSKFDMKCEWISPLPWT